VKRTNPLRAGSEATLLGSEATLLESEATLLESEATLLESEATLLESEAALLGSEATPLGSEATPLGSEATLLGSEATLLSSLLARAPVLVPLALPMAGPPGSAFPANVPRVTTASLRPWADGAAPLDDGGAGAGSGP